MSTKIQFWGLETAGWGGGLLREGVRKVRALPRSLSSLGLEGGSRDVPGILPGCPGPLGCSKSLCKKSSCTFFVPYQGELKGTDLR